MPALPSTEITILESISDGVFTVDRRWRITYFNRAAEKITGVDRAEAVGKSCREVFRSSLCGDGCPLRRTLASGRPLIEHDGRIRHASGREAPVSISTAVLRDPEGRIIGGAETFRDLSEVHALRKELNHRNRPSRLICQSPRMRAIRDALGPVAESPSTVLLLGETGTGKELAARTIHDMSPRKNGPFVAVNCGALPDTLLESELFGYKAGAFTGAAGDRKGRFAAAAGGTLLLDEIGDTSPAFQVRLLRVLQERRFRPLGGEAGEPADIRLIAATNRDLEALVRSGDFREDLYYRIHIVRLELPPLRERPEDIPLLAEYFIARQNERQGRNITGLHPAALDRLLAHSWPGNIRELENCIERCFVTCRDGEILPGHLPPEWRTAAVPPPPGRMPSPPASAGGMPDLRSARNQSEARLICAALETHDFHREAAARALGIHKTTLLRRIRRLGISLPVHDGRRRSLS